MAVSFEWNDSFEIGVSKIDNQHEHLFQLANELEENLSEENAKRMIMKLYKYTRIHFDSEEQLMSKISYPGVREHVAIHNDLINTLNDVSKQDLSKNMAITNLRMFVYNWLTDHIMHEDQQIGAYARRKASDA